MIITSITKWYAVISNITKFRDCVSKFLWVCLGFRIIRGCVYMKVRLHSRKKQKNMTSYIEYMTDISASELYDGLVGHGLFASKIPNFLTSENFLVYSKTPNFPNSNSERDYIRYSNIRNINVPRPLAIPDPFAYANLCRFVSSIWTNITDHFENKTNDETYKVSRIHIRKLFEKDGLFEMNYKNFFMDGEPYQDIVIRAKYIAQADIANCFPSIYSHSISWALVTKQYAKSNRGHGLWFNQIDSLTRNLKFGETNGLLIGPHVSNLISEIILTSVDHELTKKEFKYIRNIDDYTCYAGSYEEAEKFILTLSEELKKYELTLNSKKSKIVPLPKAEVKNWVTKLNHFNFTNTYTATNGKEGIRVKELKGFFDFAIELMLEEGSDVSVINYAIQIISGKFLGVSAKNYYIKQVHHLVLLYPYLINLLDESVFNPHEIDITTITQISKDIYEYGIRSKIYEACSYSIYYALKYNFDLQIATLKTDSIASNDCIFMLLAFRIDMKYQRKSYLKEYKDHARTLQVTDFHQYWLYIFEVLPLTDHTNEYKHMKRQGITFIKPGY